MRIGRRHPLQSSSKVPMTCWFALPPAASLRDNQRLLFARLVAPSFSTHNILTATMFHRDAFSHPAIISVFAPLTVSYT